MPIIIGSNLISDIGELLRNEVRNNAISRPVIMSILNQQELNDAAENYLYTEHADIPAFVVAKFIEEAAEEYLEEFTTAPRVSPRIEAKIEEAIALYRQLEAS